MAQPEDHENDPPADHTGHFSASGALAVIEDQRGQSRRRLQVQPAPILASWGTAWLAGFGVLYFAASNHDAPMWAGSTVLIGLSVLAVAVSFSEQIRRAQGIAGPSRVVAARYGWSWPLALASTSALDWALSRQDLSAAALSLLWPGSFVLVVGVLLLAGGALFSDRLQYGLGVWMVVVAAAAVSAGFPSNFAVMAGAGGGGMLAVAGFSWTRAHRKPRLA